MTVPPIPENEAERLALLRKHRLEITGREAEFDRIVAAAADLFETPIALVNLVLEDEQRTLGACGVPNVDVPRDMAFCAYTILGREPLVVEDARDDPRFSANPLVTGSAGVRFYAGAPLMFSERLSVGSLCLIDTRPRSFGETERRRLRRMADIVIDMIRMRLGALIAAEAQEEALAARRRLEEVVDAMPAGLALYDAERKLRFANQRFRDVFSASGEFHPQQGMTLQDVTAAIHAQGHRVPSEGEEFVAAGGLVRVHEVRLADGKWLRNLEVETASGEVITIDIDITDIKRTQERLKAQKGLLATTMERIEHGILVLDSELRIEMFNDNYFLILQLSEAVKRFGAHFEDILLDLARRGDLGAGAPEELVATKLASVRRNETVRETLSLNGGRTVECWRGALPSGRFVIVATDISARRRVEAMKDEFISTVSHELRTPLTSIAGSLGLIAAGAGGGLDKKGRQLLDIARNNSDRLIRIINDLLDIGKAEAGKITLDMAPLDLAAAAGQAVEQNAPYAQRFNVTLEVSADEPLVARADTYRLQQVLGNLISNAIKFSPSGGRVSVTLTRIDGMARLSVTDRGTGIPETFRDRLFTKFAQADASDRRARGGTGLGLSIARSLTEAMGGRISFETETGRGSTFHVDLPALAAAGSELPETEPFEGRGVLLMRGRGGVERLERVMREAGLVVQEAASLDEALTLAAEAGEKNGPAALLLDIALLETGDGDLAERVRRLRGLSLGLVSAAPLEEAAPDSAPKAVQGGRRARILHVEDDVNFCRLVERALSPIGDVTCAHDLPTAERLVAEQEFDVAILDIGLPGGSGADLIRPLKAQNRPSLIVVFSAHDADDVTAAQVAAFLTKSCVSVLTMAETVRRIVQTEDSADYGRARP